MKEWIKRWGPAILVMGIIFFASNTPSTDIPGFGIADFFVKKGGHMLGYALLAAAYFHALDNGKRNQRILIFITIISAILYAASDEFHQAFIPGRTPAIMDICVDAIGSFLGIAAFCFVRRRFAQT
jgi:VanZ family protein